MSEQQNLISNINEMMEEYVVNSGKEATHELQTVAIQDKGAEIRTETEKQPEESRIRKRDAKE